MQDMIPEVPDITRFNTRVQTRVGIEAIYAPYVELQATARKVFEKGETMKLPWDLDYDNIHGLSLHEKSLLKATKPMSVGQAQRIEGMTASGTLRLLAYVQKGRRDAAKAVVFEEVAGRKKEFMAN
jgi:tRNA uridine 5-carboxymethylaminomethyl modification enzyme